MQHALLCVLQSAELLHIVSSFFSSSSFFFFILFLFLHHLLPLFLLLHLSSLYTHISFYEEGYYTWKSPDLSVANLQYICKGSEPAEHELVMFNTILSQVQEKVLTHFRVLKQSSLAFVNLLWITVHHPSECQWH